MVCPPARADNASVTTTPQAPLETKKEIKEAAERFYLQYQKLDRETSLALIDLYTPDAAIHTGVERERGGIVYDRLSKEAFKARLEASAKSERSRALNSSTVYGPAHIEHINHGQDGTAVALSFKATARDSGIKVHWLLRELTPGNWQIFDERSIAYPLRKRP